MQNEKKQNSYFNLFLLFAILLIVYLLFNSSYLSSSASSTENISKNIIQNGGATNFLQLYDTINNFKKILN
jgi:hypothetical protein